MFVQVTLRPEFVCIVAKYGAITIALPDVGYAYSAFWNEHAFVPVIFGRGMIHVKWYARAPGNGFFDDCSYVWETSVAKRRQTVAANHSIQFGLSSALYLGEGDHSKCPPMKGRSGRSGTRGTGICRILRRRTIRTIFTYYNDPARYAIAGLRYLLIEHKPSRFHLANICLVVRQYSQDNEE
jgi:hypothetical protein